MEGAIADGQLAFAKTVVHCAKDKAIAPLETKLSHAEMAGFVSAMERKGHHWQGASLVTVASIASAS